MPLFKNKASGVDFDGLTDSTGYFVPANTGERSIQRRLNGVHFHATAPIAFELRKVDPADPANAPLVLADTDADFVLEGLVLPVEDDGTSWGLRLTTTGNTGDAFFVIDFDFVETPG
jgi:hypothetical protein